MFLHFNLEVFHSQIEAVIALSAFEDFADVKFFVVAAVLKELLLFTLPLAEDRGADTLDLPVDNNHFLLEHLLLFGDFCLLLFLSHDLVAGAVGAIADHSRLVLELAFVDFESLMIRRIVQFGIAGNVFLRSLSVFLFFAQLGSQKPVFDLGDLRRVQRWAIFLGCFDGVPYFLLGADNLLSFDVFAALVVISLLL